MGIYKLTPLTSLVWFQEGPGVRNTQYTNSGVKLLNVANLIDGHIDLSTSNRYIAEEEAYGRYRHFLCDKGDLVIASSGIKVDYFDKKMGFVRQEHLPLCMNTSTIRFKVLDDNILNIRYFMYFLKSNLFKKQLSKQITGSAQLNFGPSHLKRMFVPLINMDYQNQICGILDKVYELEYKLQTELTLLNQLVKSRFIEMFGEPWFNDKEFPCYSVGQVAESVTYGTSAPASNSGQYEYLRMNNLTDNGQLDLSDLKRIDMSDEQAEKYMVKKGDVLFNRTNSIDLVGKTALFNLNNPMIIAGYLIRIRLSDKVNPVYFAAYMNMPYMKEKLRNMAKGAVNQANINSKELKSIQILIPPLSLQNEYCNFVLSIDKSKYRGAIFIHLLEEVSHML